MRLSQRGRLLFNEKRFTKGQNKLPRMFNVAKKLKRDNLLKEFLNNFSLLGFCFYEVG